MGIPAVERFAAKVRTAENGCIEWTASLNNNGYGTFWDGAGRVVVAHRWAYEHQVGPVPEGLTLDHLCRNRKCVNPKHLEPVTLWDNQVRASTIGALNAAKTSCPAGHPYSGHNLYVHAKTGNRQCRACTRARNAARRKAKKES